MCYTVAGIISSMYRLLKKDMSSGINRGKRVVKSLSVNLVFKFRYTYYYFLKNICSQSL